MISSNLIASAALLLPERRSTSERPTYFPEHQDGAQPFEAVSLGQRFPVFARARTEVAHGLDQQSYPGVARFRSQVLLATDGLLPPVPLEVGTLAVWKCQAQAFTPFDHERGYHVDARDFNREARAEKTAALVVESFADIPAHPLLFEAVANRRLLHPLGLLEREPDDSASWSFTPEATDVLSALRLQLFFPSGMRVQAEPSLPQLACGVLEFRDEFYPFDTGPLATDYRNGLRKGLNIALPPDLAKLSQIEGRLVLR